MNNFTYYRRRWAAIPLNLLLDPTVSLEAKAVAGILLAADQLSHSTLSFISDPLNLSEAEVFSALTELEAYGIITMRDEDELIDIHIL